MKKVFFLVITGLWMTSGVSSQTMYWPANQLLPMFPSIAEVIDDINEDYLTVPEAVAMVALQGYINRVQPRLMLTKNNGKDGDPPFSNRSSTAFDNLDPWLERLAPTEGFTRNKISPPNIYRFIAQKYSDCIKGFVLYDYSYVNTYLDGWKRGDAAEWDISAVPSGRYKAVMNYSRSGNPTETANMNWRVQIAGGVAIQRTIASNQWGTGNWDAYRDFEIGEIDISDDDTSITLTNYNWGGAATNFSFVFMRLKELKLVPVNSGTTITLTPGSAWLSNNEPNFPARGIYHVDPLYDRMMSDYANLAASIAHPLGYLPVSRDVMMKINTALLSEGKTPITEVVAIDQTTPITDELHDYLKNNPAILDITGLKFEIYEGYTSVNNPSAGIVKSTVNYWSNKYLYDNWWKYNSRRIILNTLTDNQARYRMAASRDIAAATGAAVVGLDIDVWGATREPVAGTSLEQRVRESRYLYETFLYDMAQSRAQTGATASAMGWNVAEGSFIQASTTYGVGALPSQFFSSGTFFGGMNHDINIPPVPKRAELIKSDQQYKSKIYIAIYMSDGDNLHYIQNNYSIRWQQEWNTIMDPNTIPISWTMAPALIDIAPGIINWYYSLAHGRDNICFVAGPSGAQYLTPYSAAMNSYADNFLGTNPTGSVGRGPNNGANNMAYAEYYTKLNEEYMRRSGLRVATLWHNIAPELRGLFERDSRFLYGATLQRGNVGAWPSSTINSRMRFELFNAENYQGNRDIIIASIRARINEWNGRGPLFIASQTETWNGNNLVTGSSIHWHNEMASQLRAEFPNYQIEFVRADHWFSLFNENAELPFDLCMSASTIVTSNIGDNMAKLTNGSSSKTNVWETSHTGDKIINFNFGKVYEISRYVLRKAKISPTGAFYDIGDYMIEYSLNGITYDPITIRKDCSEMGVLGVATDIDIDIVPVNAQFIRLTIHNPDIVKIANVEIYGKWIPTPTIPVALITVNSIDGINAITANGGTLQMQAAVLPVSATNKTVTWSASPSSIADISNNGLLTAKANGTVVVTAKANDDSDIYGETSITISGQPQSVTSITVSGAEGATTITTPRGTLQMLAEVLPEDAVNKTVRWSVTPTPGIADISNTGLLTATGNGRVTVRATANDGSEKYGLTNITISGQMLTGFEAPDFVPNMKIYPNPFADELRIVGAEGCTLRVIDSAGAAVHIQKINSSNEIIRLEHLSKGVYFFRVEKDGQTKTVKILKAQ